VKTKLNIALLGYGRMGKEIELIAALRNIGVTQKFDIDNPLSKSNRKLLDGVDVAIDFSSADCISTNVEHVAAQKTNIVIGTTGWEKDRSKVEGIVRKSGIGMVSSANFSLGMNIFFRIAAVAAESFDEFNLYDAAISEIHHKRKKDSPSGTALALGKILLNGLRRKNKIVGDAVQGEIAPDALHISSMRVGEVAGIHSVLFDSEADSIELIHTAKNRSGFALGALLAAEWVKGKKGVFTMEDVMRKR